MERYVLLVWTLVYIYVTFSYAEETKETANSVQRLESQANVVVCPDGKVCQDRDICCPSAYAGSYFCCAFGARATCCSDGRFCCPPGYACLIAQRLCSALTESPALPVQAIMLVNSIDKRGRDGTAGMDSKDSKTPSQQVETAWKRNGFIGVSGNVFSPDEKYLCPDGTSICKLSSGIYGCCHLVRGRRILKHILP